MLSFTLENGNVYIRFNLIYQNTLKYLLRKEYCEKIFLKKLFGYKLIDYTILLPLYRRTRQMSCEG